MAAGTGGDMLDSSAEFSERLTLRPAITGVDHLKSSLTSTFRNLALQIRAALDCSVLLFICPHSSDSNLSSRAMSCTCMDVSFSYLQEVGMCQTQAKHAQK